jgi:Uma2 family endonuclease
MPAAQKRPDHHYTYADYLKFSAGERWEFIHGKAYQLPQANSTPHQDVLGELLTQIGVPLRGKPCKVFMAPMDVRFERSDKTDKVVQPDLFVVCDSSKITPQGIVGAPDWVVEVLSPATASRDQITKRALYEAEGVREYWLVHPIDRILTIYRQVAASQYGPPEILEMKGRIAIAALPGLEIDWDLWEPLFPLDSGSTTPQVG